MMVYLVTVFVSVCWKCRVITCVYKLPCCSVVSFPCCPLQYITYAVRPESRFRCYVTIFAICHATLNVRIIGGIKVRKKDNSLHKLGPPVINIVLI